MNRNWNIYGFLLKMVSSYNFGGVETVNTFEVTQFSVGTVTAGDLPNLSEYEIIDTSK